MTTLRDTVFGKSYHCFLLTIVNLAEHSFHSGVICGDNSLNNKALKPAPILVTVFLTGMQKSSPYPKCKRHISRQMASGATLGGVLLVCLFVASPRHQVLAQSKPAGTGKSPLCSRDNALEMIKEQVDLTKTFNNTIRRITVLIRAADLLWPYQQGKARAVFTEAFELATENEKENVWLS
jgi:hypothetical protein